MAKRGRPKGTLTGFDIRQSKWAVAFLLRDLLKNHGMAATKASLFVFCVFIDAKELLAIQIGLNPDGTIKFEFKINDRQRAGNRDFRQELRLQGGVTLDAKNFKSQLDTIERNLHAFYPLPADQADWLLKLSANILLATFGAEPELQALNWQKVKALAPCCILPAFEPIAASEPPVLLVARLAGKMMAKRKFPQS